MRVSDAIDTSVVIQATTAVATNGVDGVDVAAKYAFGLLSLQPIVRLTVRVSDALGLDVNFTAREAIIGTANRDCAEQYTIIAHS